MFVGILDQCTGYISLVLNTYALIIVFYEISLKYFFPGYVQFSSILCVIKEYHLSDQALMTNIPLDTLKFGATLEDYITNNSRNIFNKTCK